MRDNRRHRLPVLNSDNSPLFVIHLSILTDFISTQALSAPAGAKPVTDLTISDLQTVDELYQQILAYSFTPYCGRRLQNRWLMLLA
jgi:hypothetical protein